MREADAQARAIGLVHGYMLSQVLGVAARLGLPELLRDGPHTAEKLAGRTGTQPAALHRLLRALDSAGVAERVPGEGGGYVLTEFGAALCPGGPAPAAALADLFTSDAVWRPWGRLLHSVRTGETAFEAEFGMPAFAYFAEHPQVYGLFNAAMAENARGAAPLVAEGYDFSRFRTVVDVGGGNGALLAALLAAHPAARGVLLDTADGVAGAPGVLGAAGVADRCRVVAGDFFAEVPSGGDAYVLKSVIHDWDDERSRTILAACRRAMEPGATLLLVEPVLPPEDGPPAPLSTVLSDLNMLVMAGGRERTEADFAALLDASGFTLESVGPALAPTDFRVLTAVPHDR
ncbi:methyltransferase [Streptomyces sp. TRM 70351]|uniref:methyltransferase n=1 Tax=Streptomyces sp. TRM 70351 TaxID=3116552 RepID=UPI002E7BBD6D|nr:methyltransferase [Streptomyces sp. TRM 70351]MEE1930894.1 methyltransferase [Streptomyces sp. TRM 70351]